MLFRGGELFEKPADADEDRKFLRMYDGITPFGFVTGITVTNTATDEIREGYEDGEIVMGPFDDEFIESWIAEGTYMQYAGGFTFLSPRFQSKLVKLSGSADTLVGMPVALAKNFLTELGWKNEK